jgi:hypothetical protein
VLKITRSNLFVSQAVSMGKKRNPCKILIGRSEAKTSLERLWHRQDDNIKLDLQETGCEKVN